MSELIVPFVAGYAEALLGSADLWFFTKGKVWETAATTTVSTYLYFYMIDRITADAQNMPEITAMALGGAAGVVSVMKAGEVRKIVGGIINRIKAIDTKLK